MKKLLLLLSALILLTLPCSVNAATGDITGKIYSTDIRAYINDVEVESYNIGGRTAVVIEDILRAAYAYNDVDRTLKFYSLSPAYLVEYKSKQKQGKIAGNIYETDIKASVYDVVLPSYNIGGKTAVVIEDLGDDGCFSSIGGKYIWNETDRIIRLEFMYENSAGQIPSSKTLHIAANENMTEAEATFTEAFHCMGGNILSDFSEFSLNDAIIPINAQGETIGYYFCKMLDNITAFMYFSPDKLKVASEIYTPYPYQTREEIITHFVNAHSAGAPPRVRFDTDDYSFIYIAVAFVSSTSYNLVQVYDDGTYIDYKDQIDMRNRAPSELTIDNENETVTFKHIDRYTHDWFTNYEIDLKSGTITAK